MNLRQIIPSLALMGAVSIPLASSEHASAQPANKTGRPITPVTTTTKPITYDTGTSSTSAATDPVGFTTAALPANSDSIISIPLTRPAVFSGAISSIASNTITVAASANFTATQFVYDPNNQHNTYYAIVGPLLTTLTNTVTVTNGSTSVTGSGFTPIQAGDELMVNGLAYNVASVTSDTVLVLSRAFTGTTASGLTAQYDHSPKEGSYYTVTANGTNTLTVNLNGDSLSTVAAGTTVTLIPYWTLGTAFPAADAGTSYVASTGTQPRNRQTQILFPDMVTAGIDLAPTAVYYYYGGMWTADGTTSANDVVLPLTSYFTVRNAATATTFTPTGGVYMNRLTAPLDTQQSSGQDNSVALARPASSTLNDLNLVSSGAFASSTGDAPRNRTDTLLVYDNTATGIDKSPTAVYYYNAGGWRLSGATDTSVDYGNTLIPYGTGFKIRKASTPQGATSFWQNTRNY